MAKSATKVIQEAAKRIVLGDDKLAWHLERAEAHLIEAVKLLQSKHAPKRSEEYFRRLVRTQEGATALYREELIRIRGPLRAPKLSGRRK